MKSLALLLLMSPLSVMSGKLVELQCKTQFVPHADMINGHLNFNICGTSGCCFIDEINDPNIHNWQQGALDSFTGTELQECNGFDIPDGGLSSFTISHSGDDAWGGEQLDSWSKVDDTCMVQQQP